MLFPVLTALVLSSAPPDPLAEAEEPLRLRANASFGLGIGHGIVGAQLGLNLGVVGAFGSVSVFSPLARRGHAEQTSTGFGGGLRLFGPSRQTKLFVQAALFHEIPHPSILQIYELSVGPRTSASLTANARFALTPILFFDVGVGIAGFRSLDQRWNSRTGPYWVRTEGLGLDATFAVGVEL